MSEHVSLPTVKNSEVTQEVFGERHGIISVHAFDDHKLTAAQIEAAGQRIFEQHGETMGEKLSEVLESRIPEE